MFPLFSSFFYLSHLSPHTHTHTHTHTFRPPSSPSSSRNRYLLSQTGLVASIEHFLDDPSVDLRLHGLLLLEACLGEPGMQQEMAVDVITRVVGRLLAMLQREDLAQSRVARLVRPRWRTMYGPCD